MSNMHRIKSHKTRVVGIDISPLNMFLVVHCFALFWYSFVFCTLWHSYTKRCKRFTIILLPFMYNDRKTSSVLSSVKENIFHMRITIYLYYRPRVLTIKIKNWMHNIIKHLQNSLYMKVKCPIHQNLNLVKARNFLLYADIAQIKMSTMHKVLHSFKTLFCHQFFCKERLKKWVLYKDYFKVRDIVPICTFQAVYLVVVFVIELYSAISTRINSTNSCGMCHACLFITQ